MFATLLGWLGNLLGGPFAKAAVDAYRAKLSADNTSEKVAAGLAARELAVEQREREVEAQIIVAEQGRWYTALPRPLFAAAFITLNMVADILALVSNPRLRHPR